MACLQGGAVNLARSRQRADDLLAETLWRGERASGPSVYASHQQSDCEAILRPDSHLAVGERGEAHPSPTRCHPWKGSPSVCVNTRRLLRAVGRKG